jgi:hypothetical protein
MTKPKKTRYKTKGARAQALKLGFRSGFEMEVSEFLASLNRYVGYEEDTILYTQPEKPRKYTPDFILLKKDGSKMYLETKGRWTTDDRLKHGYIRACHPELDIRFVFQNPNQKIRKGSKTSYADYCEKKGFAYSPLKKQVPPEWLEE